MEKKHRMGSLMVLNVEKSCVNQREELKWRCGTNTVNFMRNSGRWKLVS